MNHLLKPWAARMFLTKISSAVIIITAILSTAIVGLSIYGNNVGNFVIAIEDETNINLSLSEDGNFDANGTSLLYAPGLTDITPATYIDIPTDISKVQGNASDSDKRYMAYGFYLKNTSPIAVTYTMSMTINKLYLGVDKALRVMIITDDKTVIYAKAKDDGTPETHPDIERPYGTTKFLTDTTVCEVVSDVFAKGDVKKYTVVMWLEGWDEDCGEDIKGGAIRLTMDFTAR